MWFFWVKQYEIGSRLFFVNLQIIWYEKNENPILLQYRQGLGIFPLDCLYY